MKQSSYNYISSTTKELDIALRELKACHDEKENILKYIEELKSKNLLETRRAEVAKLMNDNLNDYKRVVKKIKKLKN